VRSRVSSKNDAAAVNIDLSIKLRSPFMSYIKGLAAGNLADGEGFEPTEACASAVFKTATINHSDTHPQG
jgi:hypothetical protein